MSLLNLLLCKRDDKINLILFVFIQGKNMVVNGTNTIIHRDSPCPPPLTTMPGHTLNNLPNFYRNRIRAGMGDGNDSQNFENGIKGANFTISEVEVYYLYLSRFKINRGVLVHFRHSVCVHTFSVR